jgi:2-phosphoglycerate kinase
VVVESEELHKNHFYWRTRDVRQRPGNRYLNNFKKIRRIQKYMESSALIRSVPRISHIDLDATLSEIIDHVIARAIDTLERGAKVGEEKVLERAVEAIGRHRGEGSAERETVS